ncbi:hypothetical protein BDF21DRAFT_393971 [Thamnidium elegans]|nr:hypothetical protein BDF21DRAFT_393971 [Thamnidium elegans]
MKQLISYFPNVEEIEVRYPLHIDYLRLLFRMNLELPTDIPSMIYNGILPHINAIPLRVNSINSYLFQTKCACGRQRSSNVTSKIRREELADIFTNPNIKKMLTVFNVDPGRRDVFSSYHGDDDRPENEDAKKKEGEIVIDSNIKSNSGHQQVGSSNFKKNK